MMGQLLSGQERLFYSFNMEDHIPANHLLRNIDRCLDLSDLRHYLADFYSSIGRPSIDPELMTHHLSTPANRLRDIPDESSVLPEHPAPENRMRLLAMSIDE